MLFSSSTTNLTNNVEWCCWIFPSRPTQTDNSGAFSEWKKIDSPFCLKHSNQNLLGYLPFTKLALSCCQGTKSFHLHRSWGMQPHTQIYDAFKFNAIDSQVQLLKIWWEICVEAQWAKAMTQKALLASVSFINQIQ